MLLAIGNRTYLPDVMQEGCFQINFEDKYNGIADCNKIGDEKQTINYLFTSVLDSDSISKNTILARRME